MWPQLLNHLISFYKKHLGITLSPTEQIYLASAFTQIDNLWLSNLEENITQPIRSIMLAEAPLWGSKCQYIYNLKNSKPTSFFNPKNLQDALIKNGITPNPPIDSKTSLVNEFNKLGFLIIDVSPFALNTLDTLTDYPQLEYLGQNLYYDLVQPTLSLYLDYKLKYCSGKLLGGGKSVKVFYRYRRVQKFLGADISKILNNHGLSVVSPPNDCISKQGGSIDINKLANVI